RPGRATAPPKAPRSWEAFRVRIGGGVSTLLTAHRRGPEGHDGRRPNCRALRRPPEVLRPIAAITGHGTPRPMSNDSPNVRPQRPTIEEESARLGTRGQGGKTREAGRSLALDPTGDGILQSRPTNLATPDGTASRGRHESESSALDGRADRLLCIRMRR